MTDKTDLPPKGEAVGMYQEWSYDQMQAYDALHHTVMLEAEIERLREEVKRLQEIVRPRREDECLTLDHWRIRAYALEENWSRCSRACAIEQDKREQAEARAERLAEALKDIRSLSFINSAMQPNPLTLTAMLGDIHQIADAAIDEAMKKETSVEADGTEEQSMNMNNDGGSETPEWELTGFGMPLRDYFAAKAMVALIAEPVNEGQMISAWHWTSHLRTHTKMNGPDIIAHAAYIMADAMLKARETSND